VFISLWSCWFVRTWQQKQNELKVTWDLHHLQDKQIERYEYEGKYIVDKISDKQSKAFSNSSLQVRRVCGLGIMVLFGAIMVAGVFLLARHLISIYEDDNKKL
jgi:hypothetical protein